MKDFLKDYLEDLCRFGKQYMVFRDLWFEGSIFILEFIWEMGNGNKGKVEIYIKVQLFFNKCIFVERFLGDRFINVVFFFNMWYC